MIECVICERGFNNDGTDPLKDVEEMLEKGIEDWKHLNGEERHGILVNVLHEVEEIRNP